MEKTIKKIKLSPKTYIEPISMYPKMMYKIKAKGLVEPILIDAERFHGITLKEFYSIYVLNSFYGRWGKKHPSVSWKCKL